MEILASPRARADSRRRPPCREEARTRTGTRMRIKVLPWQDTSSPGELTPERGERDPEPEEWIEIEDDLMTPDLVAVVERDGGWRPPHPRLLPPERFADRGPTHDEKRGLRARTVPDETGRRSRTVHFRLGRSCAGWGPRQPSTEGVLRRRTGGEPDGSPGGDPRHLGEARPSRARSSTRGPRRPTRSESSQRRSTGPTSRAAGPRLP